MNVFLKRARLLGDGVEVPVVYDFHELDASMLFTIAKKKFKVCGQEYSIVLHFYVDEKPNFNTIGAIKSMGISERQCFKNFRKNMRRGRVEDLYTLARCLMMMFCIAFRKDGQLKYMCLNVRFEK